MLDSRVMLMKYQQLDKCVSIINHLREPYVDRTNERGLESVVTIVDKRKSKIMTNTLTIHTTFCIQKLVQLQKSGN